MQRHPPPTATLDGNPVAIPEQGEHLADELFSSVPSCPECSPLPLTTRIAFAVISVLLVCSAAVAASAIIARPPAGRPLPVAMPAAPIHGALALRPDLLRQAQWPFSGNGGFAPASGGAAAHASARVPDGALQRPRHTLASANPAAGSTQSAIAVVRDFYRALATDPSRALELVSAEVLGGRGTEVARAWEDAASISPRHVEARPDGSVVTDVVAEYPDGSWTLLRQLLVVELGSAPKIVHAEVLSARHIDRQ